MKRIILGIVMVLALAFTQKSEAQVRVGVSINIADQPSWRPDGYNYAEYYYIPDIETYYYVPRKQFIYQSNGQWVFSNSLPSKHSSYDLNNGYKVVINRPYAYRYFDQDRSLYGNFRSDNGNHNGWYKRVKAKENKQGF